MRPPRRLPLSLVPLALAALALVAVGGGALSVMAAEVGRARQVSEELREAYEVSQRLLQARAMAQFGVGDDAVLEARISRALPILESSSLPEPVRARVAADIAEARRAGRRADAPVNHALNVLAVAVKDLRREAAELDASASRLRLWGSAAVGVLVVSTAGFALAVGVQRRRKLEEAVRRQAAELARAERLASVGFLAAGVAHEINNPLAIIAAEAELAARTGADPALAEALKVIREEAARCKAITARLLETARGGGAREEIDLLAEARQVAALAQKLDQARGCAVRIEGAAPAHALADPGPLRQVLLNLVVNAMEAAPQGEVVVRVESAGGGARVEVRDDGAGIAPADLPRIFEPFFTTKRNPATPGLGLGLAVAQAIVTAQGGRLSAHSGGPGLGSVFTVDLPSGEPA